MGVTVSAGTVSGSWRIAGGIVAMLIGAIAGRCIAAHGADGARDATASYLNSVSACARKVIS